jgi:hypothetical protein
LSTFPEILENDSPYFPTEYTKNPLKIHTF